MMEKLKKLAQNRLFWPISLTVMTLATRLPFMSRILYHWDSVQAVLAIDKFDPIIHQPQPPGYILYIALAKLIAVFISDHNLALNLVSVIFSVVAVLGIYYLGTAIFNRLTGLIAAIMTVFSPLVWFYGEVGLSYIVAFAFASFTALYLYRFLRRYQFRDYLIAMILAALALGIRQDMVIFLGPLAILCLIFGARQIGWQKTISGILIFLIITLAWFLPLIHFSGGWREFIAINRLISNDIQGFSPLWVGNIGLVANLKSILAFSVASLQLGLVAVILVLVYQIESGSGSKFLDIYFANYRKIHFIFVWLFCSLLFGIVIITYNPGHIFGYLPILIILAGYCVVYLGENIARWARQKNQKQSYAFRLLIKHRLTYFFLILIIIFDVVIFGGWWPKISGYANVREVSQVEVRLHDRLFLDLKHKITQNFDPAHTLIIEPLAFWNFGLRHFQYYLPQYRVIQVREDKFIQKPAGGRYYFTYQGKISFIAKPDLTGIKTIIFLVPPYSSVKDYFGLPENTPGISQIKVDEATTIYYSNEPNKFVMP